MGCLTPGEAAWRGLQFAYNSNLIQKIAMMSEKRRDQKVKIAPAKVYLLSAESYEDSIGLT